MFRSLSQLAKDAFQKTRESASPQFKGPLLGGAFSDAREYVQRFIENEESDFRASPGWRNDRGNLTPEFDWEESFLNACESLEYDIVDAMSERIDEPESVEWLRVEQQLQLLMSTLNDRQEEIIMASQEDVSDDRINR